MKFIKKIFALLFMFLFLPSIAMENRNTDMPSSETNDISLVFMGITGAGKSTLINACYNFSKRVKWNKYPKFFPIPTEFQPCNVPEYSGRNVENHAFGQLSSVTKEPSKYVVRAQNFVLNLMDCPGMADPEGLERDITNTNNIINFLANIGGFSAICIVLPATINRETAETKYAIEQIKTIIPKDAYGRIFICVTNTTADNNNIRTFVQSVSLPDENIFNFENFGLSQDGYFDDLNRDIDNDDIEVGDPFSTENNNISDNDRRKIDNIIKIKDSWKNSHLEFNKLIEKAGILGKYISNGTAIIADLKNSEKNIIITLNRVFDLIEQCQLNIEISRKNYEQALNDYNTAKSNYEQAEDRLDDYVMDRNHSAFSCSQYDILEKKLDELEAGEKLKKTIWDNRYFTYLQNINKLPGLSSEKYVPYENLCKLQAKLHEKSLSARNLHIIEYCNTCIRNQNDTNKIQKLQQDQRFYMDLYKSYMQQ